MSSMLGWLKRNRFAIIITVLYLIASIMLVICHEPWTDEANPYLVAKHIGFSNFFEIIRGEPHPILWTLMLAPFAKLGLPLVASHIISLVIMTVAVWLLVKYAPFPKWAKIIVVLSAAFFYFNPVISRDYCLVPLAAVLTCMAYKSRFEHPVRFSCAIALLLQTHFLATGLAAVLYIVFCIECLKRRVGPWRVSASVLIVGASVALCAVCAIGSLMGQVIIRETMQCCGGGGRTDMPNLADYFPAIDVSVFGMAVPVIETALVLILFYLLLRQRRQFLYVSVAVLVNVIVLTFVYRVYGNAQKDAINLVFILVAFWTIYYDKPKDILSGLQKKIKSMDTIRILRKRIPISMAVFVFPFAMSVPNVLMASAYDLGQPFSGGRAIAQYINSNLPAGSVVVVPSYAGLSLLTAVAVELEDGRILWDALNEEPLSYIDYTLPTRVEPAEVPVENIDGIVRENFGDVDKVYLLNIEGPSSGWREIQRFPGVINKYFVGGVANLQLYAADR